MTHPKEWYICSKREVVTLPTFYSVSTTIAVHILQNFAKICILCTEMTNTQRKINTAQNAANGSRTAHFERSFYEHTRTIRLPRQEFLFCLNLLILCGFPHNRRVHYNDFTTFEKVFRYDWNGR